MTRNREAVYIKFFFILFFSAFCFINPSTLAAQDIKGIPPDVKIDPEILKNASAAELQRLLSDNNKTGEQAGDDLHKQAQKTLDSVDIKKDDIRKSTTGPSDVYGADLFRNTQILSLSALNTPPDDYPIGVGDNIVVTLWGGADFEQEYVVGRDGSIFPRGLGKITVQGLPFAQAREIIMGRFRRVVPGGTKISVALGQPRSIVVQVSGNVETPGPVVVSAFTNAMNVVALAGGVTEHGNLRRILVSRNGKVIDSIDVYKYLFNGDYGNQVYLENNDFIIVPFYDKKVLATGQFKRPMYYQLREDEGISDLIRYAGGFTSDAYASSANIIRSDNEQQTIKTINLKAIGMKASGQTVDEPLKDGDIIAVNLINPGLRNRIVIRGAVAYPNLYEVREGDRLFDVINRAGGITPNTYLDRAYIYRGAADSATTDPTRVSVNLKDLNKNLNSPDNLPIYANDVIELFSRNQFDERKSVTIQGEVRKPGTYEKYGKMTLKDLLYFANGLLPSAEYGKIVISRVVEYDSTGRFMTPVNNTVLTYSVNKDLALDNATEEIVLMPFDQVIVRRNPQFNLQNNIQITGQVLYPGTYPKIDPLEKLSSFINRAGGVTNQGNLAGALLYRLKDSTTSKVSPKRISQAVVTDSLLQELGVHREEKAEYVAIDLDKALSDPGGKYDIPMMAGDILYIPQFNPTVSIQGKVQNNFTVFYEKGKTGAKYYIDQAGGFSQRPWRKRIYVTYANGTSKSTKNIGFIHIYPKVEAGSTIIVPERPEPKGFGDKGTQILATTIPVLIAYLLTQIKW
ncbi:MAG: SLBB domain-containing protein [Chitinophagaceae bacterium]|nr:SLBB domain-containing protein [Chitinophagaceae bacterium]